MVFRLCGMFSLAPIADLGLAIELLCVVNPVDLKRPGKQQLDDGYRVIQ